MEKNILCGFIWCHGAKDFSLYETDAISEEDRKAIETILSKYDTTGTSVRNVYEDIKDYVCEEY